MKCLKNLFPVFVSILLVLNLSITNGDSSKSTKRYRNKQASNTDHYPDVSRTVITTQNKTSDIYPSPNISSSRAMTVSGLAQEFDSADRDQDIFQPFNTDFGQWGNHRLNSESSSSGSKASSPKYSYQSVPVVASRHTITSAEKFDKFGAINNYGQLGSGSGGQVYTSYPIGASGGVSGNGGSNPILDFYDKERERDRAARDILLHAAAANKLNALNRLNTFGVNPAVAAAAASSLLGNAVLPPIDFEGYGDPLALASDSGHGWGWGWKEPHHHHGQNDDNAYYNWVKYRFKQDLKTKTKLTEYTKSENEQSQLNTNALGLLGLLGLLSLLSNIVLLLTTTTTTTTVAGRRKRSTSSFIDMDEESGEAKRTRIFYEVLPYLSPVAHAMNGVIPAECTLLGVCLVNKVLVKEFGLMGRPAASRVTEGVVKLLGKIDSGDGLKKQIELAGLSGRNQNDCRKVYPVCKSMQTYGPHSVPFRIQMHQVPYLIEKLQKQTSYSTIL